MCPLVWAPNLYPPAPFGVKKGGNRKFSIAIDTMYCADLASKDSSTVSHCRITNRRADGLSDPFVVVKAGGKKEKSPIMSKTLNPTWRDLKWQLYKIPPNRLTSSELSENDKISLKAYDYDEYSADDYEGEVNFTIASLLPELPSQKSNYFMKTWKLENTKGHKHEVKGSLSLSFMLTSRVYPSIISSLFEVEEGTMAQRRHFGHPLKTSLQRSKDDGLLHVTEATITQLLERGIWLLRLLTHIPGTQIEGIIRIPGNKEVIESAKAELDGGMKRGYSIGTNCRSSTRLGYYGSL